MHRTALVTLSCLVLVSGCGRRLPPPADGPVILQPVPCQITAESAPPQMPTVRPSEAPEQRRERLVKELHALPADGKLAALKALPETTVRLTSRETVPVLMPLLHDADPRVRLQAALRLQWCGSAAREAVPVLKSMMVNDPDPDVKVMASMSLAIVEQSLVQ